MHNLSAAGPFLGHDFICFKLPTNGRELCQDQTADFSPVSTYVVLASAQFPVGL